MRALVTGAAGFIGSTLVNRLLREGFGVVGVDSFTDYYDPADKQANLEVAAKAGDDFEFVKGDLNEMDLAKVLADVDYVFHSAGQPGVRKSWGVDFGSYTANNIDATQRLLEAALHAPRLKRLVYASSSSVYGNAPSYPTRETDLPRPVSPYGVTKLAGEHLCSLYAANFDLPVTSLRYFTVYGPRQRPDMAFTRFVTAAVTGGQISIYGDGTQIRDFTYVEDVVAANLAAARTDVPAGSVFNVAGGTHTTVNEVLGLLGSMSEAPLNVSYTEAVAGDVTRTGGSTDLTRAQLGWSPVVDLETGLANQLDWARGRLA